MRKLSLKELRRPDLQAYRSAPKNPVVLVLDNIRSGLNVGAAFRTADGFGLSGIHLCGITAKPPHREINKTAIGATQSVEWTYWANVRDAVDHLAEQGYTICLVEQTDRSLLLQHCEFAAGQKYAFVFGNEVTGISNEIIQLYDQSIEIPQAGTKHSFNIAVSIGIVLWEWQRKVMD